MTTIQISPEALADLQGILRYVQNDLENDLTATDTIKGIIDCIHELESSPEAGALSTSTALAENIYRYLPCDDYTVFYRYEDDTVYIVRVMYCIADNIV